MVLLEGHALMKVGGHPHLLESGQVWVCLQERPSVHHSRSISLTNVSILVSCLLSKLAYQPCFSISYCSL